jgi:pimeloyl-ACP methyl ester carboxylesterase
MSRRIWSRSFYSLALPVLFMAAVATGSTAARAENCWKKDSPVPAGMTLTGSSWQEADKGLPRHCLVTGNTGERTGSDGRTYTISFEMRLPVEWNGRFLHQVNGGNDGVVVPALGDRADGPVSGGRVPLSRGFAVLSSDSGHSSADPANKPRGLAAGAAFGLDPQARRDYGYAADMTLSPIAKAVIASYYGRSPDYSYMAGCSNGGRHAMVAAERMPENYDGFLVGNPGLNLPRAAIQHAWDVQALAKVDPDIRKSITREDGRLISSRIIEACDALDGLKDGLTSNLAGCQKAFSFDSLACKPGATEGCLSTAKVDALKKIFAGPRDSGGKALYSDWPVDGGVGMGNWRAWKVESTVAPWNNYPIIATMGAASLAYIFSTPPLQIEGVNAKLVDFLLAYDFDRDAPKVFAKDGAFSESAMDFMTPPGVDDPRLVGLQKSAHKMLVYHGQSDPVFSVNDTIRWYETLDRNLGGKASSLVRLFTAPGVTHCGSGVGLERLDALSALVEWVENGKAPASLTASVNAANKELPSSWSPERTRPLCPWPTFARYLSGDPEKAASFECANP